MSNAVLSFSERELTLLSDSILTMIDNAGQAKRLVCDTASQKAIDVILTVSNYGGEVTPGNRRMIEGILS